MRSDEGPTAARPFSLEGQHLVVIGGSSGVGFEVAREALALGARVTVGSRDRSRLEAARARLHDQATAIPVDVHDTGSLKGFFQRTGTVDHVCWSVATGLPTLSILDDLTQLHRNWDLLFWPVVDTIRAALPHLQASGSFTILTGTLRLKPVKGKWMYTTSQLAIEGLVKALAIELAPVRLNTVAPGLLDTEMWSSLPGPARAAFFASHAARLPAKRVGKAKHGAMLVLAAIANDFMTATTLTSDGGEGVV